MRIGPLTVYGTRTHGWFRLFGICIHWKDTSRHSLRFSERNGYRKPFIKIGSWWFTRLR